ncbi:MAG: hypothetical protein WCG98_07890 [bacterium]
MAESQCDDEDTGLATGFVGICEVTGFVGAIGGTAVTTPVLAMIVRLPPVESIVHVFNNDAGKVLVQEPSNHIYTRIFFITTDILEMMPVVSTIHVVTTHVCIMAHVWSVQVVTTSPVTTCSNVPELTEPDKVTPKIFLVVSRSLSAPLGLMER